jgi:hypothetical protein
MVDQLWLWALHDGCHALSLYNSLVHEVHEQAQLIML